MRALRTFLSAIKSVLIAIGLVYLIVTLTPVDNWWLNRLADGWESSKGETLIVLGGDILGDGMIGQSSYWRSVYAARAWREGGFREMMISGGSPAQPIAESMRQFVVSQGVPDSAIEIEELSNSTRENAVNVTRLLAGRPGKRVLLTSDYHIYRAVRAFRKAGLDVEPRPIPEALKYAGRWYLRWSLMITLAMETGKIAYYRWKGWL